MKTDKERLTEAIHALNELYEAALETVNKVTYSCGYASVHTLIEALEEADKVLEGN